MADLIKISDSVDTESSIIAASSTAVKAVYDLAASKLSSITAGTGITVSGNKISNSGVTSFNGSTGAVTYSAPVTSVNGSTGAVTIDTAGGMSNHQAFTSSSTFTTPKAGVYTFLMVSGGMGGANGTDSGAGKGGNGGRISIIALYLAASVSCSISIGAGGAANNGRGGDSTVTVNSITYSTVNGGDSSSGGATNTAGTAGIYDGTGGAKGSGSSASLNGGGGGGGAVFYDVTTITASNGNTGSSNGRGGAGGQGYGAGGGGGPSVYNAKGSGAGAQGIVVVYW